MTRCSLCITISMILLIGLPSTLALSLPNTHATWESETHYYEWKILYTKIGDCMLRKDIKGVWWLSKDLREREHKLGTFNKFMRRG